MIETELPVGGKRQKWSPYQKYIIALLLTVYMFNFIDRQIIAILSPLIKDDLGLSDTQLGLLKGFPFALCYAFFGFPIAKWADKGNRATIISLAVTVWSGMTVLCGLAQNYTQLLLARMGVGVGEAGCSPPAHSLISDYFPREQRATVLGLYSLGISLGSLFGILLGGLIADKFGWRWAFIIVGAPGVVLGLIVKFTLKEPERGATEEPEVRAAMLRAKETGTVKAAPSFLDALATMWKIKSYGILTLSAGLTAFCGYALGLWIVDFLFRTHDLSYAELTLPLALAIGVGGGVGTICGGFITDFFGTKDDAAYFSIPAYGHLISVPLFLLAMWTGSPYFCLGVFFFVFLLHTSVAGPYYGLVQNLAPLHLRAFASALFFFVLSILGVGLGPFLVGVFSDLLTPSLGEADALRWVLTALAPVWILASFIMLWGRKALRADLAQIALKTEQDRLDAVQMQP